ncbi:hypothetical protein ABEB36_010040 [Hypothenemus hampei]|uniref:Enoyl-CoA hydratase domain-containing protein 3, mitochondrial n=1 Tax=Hypothenemus hampei TaxID=57062 RepID=A0ABD1EIA9_HYPHA
MFLKGKSITTFLNKSLSTASVKTDFKNGIKEIIMCNSKARNTLSIEMMENLIHNIKHDQDNSNLRVIVISGEGPVFSAGHNLKELSNNKEKQIECFNLASDLMRTIIDAPVPIIAKVNGIAAAAGCQLAAQCDLVICSSHSQFSTPGANVGIFCSTPGVALARSINKLPALYMLLTGLPISAEEAYRTGLVTKVCPPEKLDEEVTVICKAILNKSRDVIELGKKFYYKQVQYETKKAYDLAGEKMIENLQLPDCKEGIQSFIEKRKPQWSK